MDQAISKFLEWGERGYTPRTLELYREHLVRFQKFVKNKPIEKLRAIDDVVGYCRYLEKRSTADSTINLSMIALRQMWKTLIGLERELGVKLPFLWDAIPLRKGVIPKSHRAIRPEEHYKLLESIGGTFSFVNARDTAVLNVLYHTGMRVSELTSLNISSIDLDDQSIKVITRKRRDHCKFRQVFFPREAKIALLTYLDIRKLYAGSDALFINLQQAERLTTRSVERMIKFYCDKAGLDPKLFRPHGYRHGWGMRAAQALMYPPHIQANLGHTNLNGSQTYFNLTNEALKKEYHSKMGDGLDHVDSYDIIRACDEELTPKYQLKK